MRTIAIVLFVVLSTPAQAGAPIAYGRPDIARPHTPGRCLCRWHGPRGGCIKWVCPKLGRP